MAAQEFPSEAPDTSSSIPDRHSENDSSEPSLSRNVCFSRLNAQAPAFVPARPDLPRVMPPPPPPPGLLHRVYPTPPNPQFHVAVPVHNHHRHQQHRIPVLYPHNQQYYGGNGGGEFSEQDVVQKAHKSQAEQDHIMVKNGLHYDSSQRIVNQVEYYFSDLNLATTDHLMRFITKDPGGYVPISIVASFKKIKAVINSHSQLATILRNSTKLVVSDDGKKVRRQYPLTELDMEELQSRIVVAENLPEDHCHQNLMKIFSAVGSVKTIRTCPPQTSNGGASLTSRSAKADGTLFSNKLHAFVEYESVDLAEKAVAELNDEANWRSGLRVRLMPRCVLKSAQAHGGIKHDGEGKYEEEQASTSDQQTIEKQLEDPSQEPDTHSYVHAVEEQLFDKEGVKRKPRSRGRGRGYGRGQFQPSIRGNLHMGTPNSLLKEQLPPAKQPPGPRMPDGTRGFAMGRGKPVSIT